LADCRHKIVMFLNAQHSNVHSDGAQLLRQIRI